MRVLMAVGLGALLLAPASSPHDYFDALRARSDHWKSYSLRTESQYLYRTLGGYAQTHLCDTLATCPHSYDAGMDAARTVIPAGKNNLQAQLFLPMGTSDGNQYVITWDSYWPDHWRRPLSGLWNYKAWNFDSGSSIWLETQMSFSCNGSAGGSLHPTIPCDTGAVVANVNVRSYNSPKGLLEWSLDCPEIGKANCHRPQYYDGTPIVNREPFLPKKGWFYVKPGVWTRHVWVIQQRANDYDLVSLWVSDETTDPVQIYHEVPVSVRPGNINYMRVEMNTSQTEVLAGRGDLVFYHRNYVMLKQALRTDVTGLLQRPLGGGVPSPPPTSPTRVVIK